MSTAKRYGRWQGGGAEDSTDVRRSAPNAASGDPADERDLASISGKGRLHMTHLHDFAAARNAALALTDCDWRLVLDADEWLAGGTDCLQALRASASSLRMLSRQVPITAMSARWIEFMQSLGQPLNLNLNLYGSDGRWMSSRKLLITVRWAVASS